MIPNESSSNRRYETWIETLIKWSEINSHSLNFEGIEKYQAEILKAFEPFGAKIEYHKTPLWDFIDSEGIKQQLELPQTITITKRPEAKHQIFLMGHLDTVFSKSHPFQKTTRLNENYLRGPGVTDMKGGLIVMLEALHLLEESRSASELGWRVCLNVDEEIGSPSSQKILPELTKGYPLALIFEPSFEDGSLASMRWGSANYTFLCTGKSAHVGRNFQDGVNAISSLSRLVSALDGLNSKYKGQGVINPGVFHGGRQGNVVADFAYLRVNLRARCTKVAQSLQKELDALIEKHKTKEKSRLEIFGSWSRPPKEETSEVQKLMKAIQACGSELNLPLQFRETGGVCDGNNLLKLGLVNIDNLGVVGYGLHTEEETVFLPSLIERGRLSGLFLRHLSEGNYSFTGN